MVSTKSQRIAWFMAGILAVVGAACGDGGTTTPDGTDIVREDAAPDDARDVAPDAFDAADADAPGEDAAAEAPDDDVPPEDVPIDGAVDWDFSVMTCLYDVLAVVAQVGYSVGDFGTVGTCPTVTRAGSAITVDYGAGCDPWPDDTVPDVWAGRMVVTATMATRTISVAFESLVVNGEAVAGTMSGTFERGGGTVTLTIALDVTLGTRCDVSGNIVVDVTRDEMVVDGSLTVNGTTFTMTGLAIANGVLYAPCPLPHGGSITYDDPTFGPLTIAFDENSPVDGTVAVTALGRTFDEVPFCTYF
jgi:hypothetical protein